MGQLLKEKVLEYLQDAHALEQEVAVMLESMIEMVQDDTIHDHLADHQTETARHEMLLRERIEELGGSLSLRKEAGALGGAMLKGFIDGVRTDKHGKMARDAWITEHTEIAAYELLERLATRAGDDKTAQIAQQIRHDEQKMADVIAANWDRFIDLNLQEMGVVATVGEGGSLS